MVDGFYIPIWNRTGRPLTIALSGWEGLRGRDDGGYVNNVQCKSNWNCPLPIPPCIMNIS
jgi:hypothetical protein